MLERNVKPLVLGIGSLIVASAGIANANVDEESMLDVTLDDQPLLGITGSHGSEEGKDEDGEGKCGEGECGEGDDDHEDDGEGQCGEGQCGEEGEEEEEES